MLVERAFGQIVGRLLVEHQVEHKLSDRATSRVARVSQPYWSRVHRGVVDPDAADTCAVGARLISGLAVSMPDLLRRAIDEVQALKSAEVERRGDRDGAVVGAAT
jgi:hypothetical protein